MARAEVTSIDKVVKIELCDHAMCTCQQAIGGLPYEDRVGIGTAKTLGNDIVTPLSFAVEGQGEVEVHINGVHRATEIVDAYNSCDGPVYSDESFLCGALYSLTKKKR